MYKLINDNKTGELACIEIKGKRTYIPIDPDNTDYQEYLTWVAAGNTAEAAD